MSIVFLCPTGTYASLVAANLHLGKLKPNSSAQEILNLPHFGLFPGKPGTFLFIGIDLEGNMVYTLGSSNEAQLIKKSAYDLLKIWGADLDRLKLYDMSKFVPAYLTWSNFFFPKEGKKFIAQKLYKRLNIIDQEIKRIFSEQDH